MATAKRLRRQAVTCAIHARQTHDEESRQRYLRLEQTYVQLAEMEERSLGQMSSRASDSERKPAA